MQQEFPSFQNRYWGKHLLAVAYGCWSTGNITNEMLNEYLEHHRRPKQDGKDNFIIEQ